MTLKILSTTVVMVDSVTSTLSELETYRIFEENGIPVAPYRFFLPVRVSPLMVIPERHVYLKAVVSGQTHKTEKGLVVRVDNPAELGEAIRGLKRAAQACEGRFEGMISQRTVEGKELMMGAVRDRVFGPVVTFGEGGPYTELRDHTVAVLPSSRTELSDLIDEHEILGPVFNGYRGIQLDKSGFLDALEGLSRMLDDETISGVDINPFMVSADECWACDGNIERKAAIPIPFRPMRSELDGVFNPESIVFFGASSRKGSLGNLIAENLQASNVHHYFINDKGGSVLGEDVYKYLDDVDGSADMAIVLVRAPAVPGVLNECGRHGIKNVAVISSGFGEIGDKAIGDVRGDDLRKQIIDIAAVYGMNLLGPNGMGFWKPELSTFFLPMNREINGESYRTFREVSPGRTTVLGQSGAKVIDVVDHLDAAGVGLRIAVSYGNADVIDTVDLLDYFRQDDETETIALYLEGLEPGRGRDFIDVALRCSTEKPIVALKPGKSEAARNATRLHTNSVAGESKIYSAVFKKTGIIEADSVSDLVDKTTALSMQSVTRSDDIIVMSNTGGFGSDFADLCKAYGLKTPEIDPAFRERITKLLPGFASSENPIDLSTAVGDETVAQVIDVLTEYEGFGGLIFMMYHGGPGETTTEILPETRRSLKMLNERGIPVCVYDDLTTPLGEEIRRAFVSDGIPVFSTDDGAVRGMSALAQYGGFLRKHGLYQNQ